MLRPVRILAALLALLAGPAVAADLYTARVPLAATDPAARTQAMTRALDTVVRRLLPHVPDAGAIARRLAPRAPALMAGTRDDAGALEVRFDAPALHGALRDAGVQPWGEPRPRVLVWLVFDSGAAPELLGADSPLAGELARAGERYGIALDLALLDADERAAVSAGTVIRLDWETLAATSVRYAPDTFGALLVSDDGQRLRARLNLSLPDGETTASTPAADSLDGVFDAAAHDLAARLAHHFLADTPAADAAAVAAAPASPASPTPAARTQAPDDNVERPRIPPAPPPAAGGGYGPGPFVVARPGETAPTSGAGSAGRAASDGAPPAVATGPGSAARPAPAMSRPPEMARPPGVAPSAPFPMPGTDAQPPASAALPAPGAPGGPAPTLAQRPPIAAAPLPPRASAADGVVVEVEGVRGGAAYRQVHAALRGLDGVTGVRPLAAGSETLTLEVRYPPGATALARTLGIEAPFEVLDSAPRSVRLRYRGP